MRTVLSLICGLLTFSTVAAQAQSPDKYRYLVDATNRMMAINARATPGDPKELSQAAAQACSALGVLVKDDAFRSDLNKWGGDGFAEQRLAFKRDFGLFVSAFLFPEREVLRRAGLSEDSVAQMLWTADYFQATLDRKVDPNKILGDLERLRSQICDGAAKLSEAARRQDSSFRSWTFGLGAVTLIVFDVVAATPSGGVATASIAVGSAILSTAVTGIIAPEKAN